MQLQMITAAFFAFEVAVAAALPLPPTDPLWLRYDPVPNPDPLLAAVTAIQVCATGTTGSRPAGTAGIQL